MLQLDGAYAEMEIISSMSSGKTFSVVKEEMLLRVLIMSVIIIYRVLFRNTINKFHNNQNHKIPKEKLAKRQKMEKKKEFISFFLYFYESILCSPRSQISKKL